MATTTGTQGRAVLCNRGALMCCVVRDRDTARLLWEQWPQFGKGTMSRSRPDFLLGGAVNVEGEGNDEELQLAPCEVIYLCDVLKCLEVHVDDALNSPTVPLNQLWKLFCETDQRFPQIYAVYRNLRLCGWVPKSGLKYGVEFLLYKEGQDHSHATYGVRVVFCSNASMPPLMWRNIMASTRNMVTVAKQLMVCFVEPLPVCQDQSIESLISMPPFAVKKLIFERWVPTQNRDQNL